MANWLKRLLVGATSVVLLSVAMLGWAFWAGNKDVPPPTLADREHAYQRALNWFKSHESDVLADGNAALWWMLRTAADRANEPYLKELVQRHLAQTYAGRLARMPWKRLVDPSADIEPDPRLLDGLTDYQRFFYHVATCQQVVNEDGVSTSQFLEGNVCRPMWRKVFMQDNVCTTHQLMGLNLIRRAQCPVTQDLRPLEEELLGDVERQMWLAPLYQDAYVQRVLTLYWMAGPERVKPIWLKRVLEAQMPDGGWSGDRQLLGAPSWLQPWFFRQFWQKFWPSNFPARPPVSDFHASTQGLLLAVFALEEVRHAKADQGAH